MQHITFAKPNKHQKQDLNLQLISQFSAHPLYTMALFLTSLDIAIRKIIGKKIYKTVSLQKLQLNINYVKKQ